MYVLAIFFYAEILFVQALKVLYLLFTYYYTTVLKYYF